MARLARFWHGPRARALLCAVLAACLLLGIWLDGAQPRHVLQVALAALALGCAVLWRARDGRGGKPMASARGRELQARLDGAIAGGEFRFHYQGKFDTAQLRLVGLEALLRWEHPRHGLVYPNEFIGLAEQTDAIVALGNWGIDAACRQLAQWRAADLPLVPVAVNISARQLCQPHLPDFVLGCLRRHAIAPGLLELEVTESCCIDDMAQATQVLRQLRALGLAISLDDYGTGHSGLSHVRMLPIHTIKIDRCFIGDLGSADSDTVIVASTIALARGLGLQVLAEGVENARQLARLRRLGCPQVQGFYLHRPACASDVAALLAAGVPAGHVTAPKHGAMRPGVDAQ
ncbi:EAL domain-containing protein [Janthinobacterium sp. FW305-129]|uniref:putative bifunctional diguanylate cyclase/phosphodiesterase n=1 Tax=Janthinobacterium sp. FW305-129 TaxID=2775054 RepID=UPI001E641EC5|nr:EAL domain-containing protein [Janthinobacterium sp. FW305-129]MCC7597851.1 EAL domain-containing protein [Janthinobacterium sp. FW305-129]